jgi:transcriptional regulator with XRE-family HTH domain
MSPADLITIRETLGLSKAEFARRLGISRSLLYSYETGQERHTGRPAPIPLTVELAVRYLQLSTPPKEPAKS